MHSSSSSILLPAPVADEVPAPVADDVPMADEVSKPKNKKQVSFSCFKVVRMCVSLGTPLEAPCDFKGFQC